MTREEEEISHLYHMGLDFVAKASVTLTKTQLEQLRGRFITEAAGVDDSMRTALQSLANACQAMKEDALD